MQNIFWAAYINEERYAAISKIETAVCKYGHIVDVQFFSDVSLTLKIEIQEIKLKSLYLALQMHMALDEPVELNSVSQRDRTLYLNVTFITGKGNLKIEVRSVPG